jgi:hypothetical protein
MFILCFSIFVGCNLYSQGTPRIDIVSIKGAPLDRAKDVRVVLKIVNDTQRAFYYTGVNRIPVYIFTETKRKDRWEPNGLMIAAIGLEEYQLAPSSEVLVEITPAFPPDVRPVGDPEPSILHPLRFRFDGRAAPGSDRTVSCYSRTCEAAEFVRKK